MAISNPPTPDPTEYEKFRKEVEAVESSLINIDRLVRDQAYIISETAKSFTTYKNELRELRVTYTQIEHLSSTVLDFANRLGNSIIKQTDIQKAQNRLQTVSKTLENDKISIIKKHEDSLQKIQKIITDNNIQLAKGATPYQDYNDLINDLSLKISEVTKKNNEITNQTTQTLNLLNTQKEALERINAKYENSGRLYKKQKDELQKIQDILFQNGVVTAKDLIDKRNFKNLIDEIKDKSKEIQNVNDASLASNTEILNVLVRQKEASEESVTENDALTAKVEEALKRVQEVLNELTNVNSKVNEGNSLYKKQNAELQTMTKTLRIISKIPILGELYDKESLYIAATQGRKTFMKEFGSQTKDLLSSNIIKLGIAVALWGKIIDYIKQGVELAKEYDKALTDTANRLAFSKEATKVLYENFYEVTQSGKDLNGGLYSGFVTMKNMGAAMGSLQDAFGTSAFINEKMLKDQILMTKQMGLTEEEAAGIQKYSILTDKSAVNILDSVLKQNKYFISNKKLIAEISKVNSEIATSYKNQPELLAKAAVQAMKLGMTLEDTRKISDSLLNFETSIEAELKAELLLGRQLNYEKARSLALDGKSAEAAAALVEEVGGLNELNKLHVISRKALAESIGLSSEELTKYAQQEQILSKLGAQSVKDLEERHRLLMDQGKVSEANALIESVRKQQNGELLAQDIAKASIAARYEASMEKVKEIFVKMSEPLIQVLEVVLKLMENLAVVKTLAVAIAVALSAAAVAFSIMTFGVAPATTLTIGGIAGLGAGIYTGVKVNDAAISPNQGLMISTPKGEMFRTDPDDNVYATPKSPDEMNSMIQPATQKSILSSAEYKTENQKRSINREKESTNKFDNTEVVAKLQQIIERMSQQVNIDSYGLSTRMALSSNFSYA